MKFFLRHLRVNYDGALVMLVFQGGMFLGGVVMVLLINTFVNEDRDFATMGSMLALIGSVFGGLLRGSGGAARYRMAISMGNTRRAYILADPLISVMNCLIGIGTAWLLFRFELWLYSSVLYPGWECGLEISAAFQWWAVLLIVGGEVLIDFCLGAIQIRFGAKGFMALWFPLCFLPMVLANALDAAKEGSTSLLAQVGNGLFFLARFLTPAMWIAVGVVILLALVFLSILCYRKAEVRI